MSFNRNLIVKVLKAEIERLEAQPLSTATYLDAAQLKEQLQILEDPNPEHQLLKGGEYLSFIREWIKQKARNGCDVTWGSHEHLQLPSFTVWDMEYLAAQCASAGVRDFLGTYVKRVDKPKVQRPKNHYDWLDENLVPFLAAVFAQATDTLKASRDAEGYKGMIVAHGDKCYQYKHKWAAAGVPFPQGVAVYLLSYVYPWSNTVRTTEEGWVAPDQWVIAEYAKLKHLMPECGPEYLN